VSDIRITAMTVFKASLPVISARKQGIGATLNAINNVLLKLDTDAGITGWGEASITPAFPGRTEAHVAALHVYLRPLVVGADPFRIHQLMERAERAVVGVPAAKGALEMALFDVVGRVLETPVCNLLGGPCRDQIPLSWSFANPDFAADREMGKRLYAEGLRVFKVKMGAAGHAQDLRRLETLRAELGPEVDLRVDYNQSLDVFDAIPKLRDLAGFRLTFIEQPVAHRQIDAMAEIARAIDTPIMADESVHSPSDALAVVKRRAADIIAVMVMKSGLLRSKEVAAIAGAAGMPCYGGSGPETGIAQSAGAHLVAATPNVSLGCEFYHPAYYLKEDILATPFPVVEGKVQVPNAPGLGIEVDEERLAKYTVECLT
jgi:muconate cycloisomerase